MSFYWDEKDRKDQEARRAINAGRVYTDTANCAHCGTPLMGRSLQCLVCNESFCLSCICDDCCPHHTGLSRERRELLERTEDFQF